MKNEATQLEGCIEISDDDGKTWTRAEEFKVEDLTGTTRGKTCYIEADTGQRFRFSIANMHGPDSVAGDVKAVFFCDGNSINSKVCRATSRQMTPRLAYCTGIRVDNTTRRPLLFDRIVTTGDDRSTTKLGSAELLGELKIEIWRVRLSTQTRHLKSTPRPAPDASIYHEQQVKKKSSHAVRFGDPMPAPPLAPMRDAFKLDKAPFYTFTFCYQSSALLDINGIRPMPIENHVDEAAASNSVELVDGPSGANSVTMKQETVKKEKRTRSSCLTAGQVIDIDDIEDEKADGQAEVARLRAEIARLRKKVKRESNVEPGAVIDLSE